MKFFSYKKVACSLATEPGIKTIRLVLVKIHA